VNDIDTAAITPWLQIMWDQKGSDLLLAGDSAPRVRVDGKLRPVEGAPVLTGAQIDDLVRTLLKPSQQATFDVEQDVDFSFSWLDRARLRGSAFTQ
jgi:twitching motility protein PilT